MAIPSASTGIAANLLNGGRTYHSIYKLPVPLLNDSVSRMRMTSSEASSLRIAKLLIIDEATMATSHALNAIDKLLREIMKQPTIPFGGKVILLGGDFRQTLPVVPHASRSAVVESSIKYSRLWKDFQRLELKTNQRSEDPSYSNWLIDLGNGALRNSAGLPENIIEIPEELLVSRNSTEALIKDIFGEGLTPETVAEFAQRAILCPCNEDVHAVNEKILNILEGPSTSYYSSDSMEDETDEDMRHYPIEFLNNLRPSGMPPHKLNLKIGAIIMLLRNLNTKRGLCNGTRLIVTDLKPNVILAKVLTGSAAGEVVFIPRINIAPRNPDLPFILKRRQFPVMLAFAMTINKSQGQTLDMVGIYLAQPVFSHGQLYVAFSRAKRFSNVKVVMVENGQQGKLVGNSCKYYTKNIVYREVLQN